jgi:hypothetical protein
MSTFNGKSYILAVMLLCCLQSFSQENSVYQNYYLSPFIINPAAAGGEDYPAAELSYKKQWLGFTNAPATILLSGNFRIGNLIAI